MTQNTPHNTTVLEGWTVVAIDDDPDSLKLINYLLEFYGATVHTAKNGQLGFAAIKTHRPDFVISDLSMPVMSGWNLIDAVQREPGLREIPIFALTAHAMRGDREKALAAGFYNYISKPLDVVTFIEQLLTLLEGIPELNAKLQRES